MKYEKFRLKTMSVFFVVKPYIRQITMCFVFCTIILNELPLFTLLEPFKFFFP